LDGGDESGKFMKNESKQVDNFNQSRDSDKSQNSKLNNNININQVQQIDQESNS